MHGCKVTRSHKYLIYVLGTTTWNKLRLEDHQKSTTAHNAVKLLNIWYHRKAPAEGIFYLPVSLATTQKIASHRCKLGGGYTIHTRTQWYLEWLTYDPINVWCKYLLGHFKSIHQCPSICLFAGLSRSTARWILKLITERLTILPVVNVSTIAQIRM